MDPTKLPPGAFIAVLAGVLIVGFLLSKGKSGSVTTMGGTDSQTNFQNAMKLQEADTTRKGLLTSALLAYDKQSKDYALGTSTLRAKTEIERQQLSNALTLGTKALDTSYGLGMREFDVTEKLGSAQIASAEKQNAQDNQTQRQNGWLSLVSNVINGIIGLFNPITIGGGK